MAGEEVAALAAQRVDAALEIDEEPGCIVDGERALGWHVDIARVDLPRQTALVQLQEGREVDHGLGHLALDHQRAVYAVLCSALTTGCMKQREIWGCLFSWLSLESFGI